MVAKGKNTDDIATAKAAAMGIVTALDGLREKRANLARQIATLCKQPHHLHARLWYRDARYAYVHIHPPGGERQKHYIGTDADKIRGAEEAIARGERFVVLSGELAQLDRALRDLCGCVQSEQRRAKDILTGQQRMPAHFTQRNGDAAAALERRRLSPS